MFPNLRLMCVGVLATIISTSCALGLFAELRISQGFFRRQSNVGASLQLESTAPAPLKLHFLAQQSTPAIDAMIKPETVDNTAGLDRSTPALLPAKSLAAPVSATEAESTTAPQAPSVSVSDAGRPNGQTSSGDRETKGEGQQPSTSGGSAASSQTPAFTVPVQQAMAESKIVPEKPSSLAPRKPSGPRRGGLVRHYRRVRPALPAHTLISLQPPYQWLPQPNKAVAAAPPTRLNRRRSAATKSAVQIWSPQETILSTVGTPPE
jgi:hypothetical protein